MECIPNRAERSITKVTTAKSLMTNRFDKHRIAPMFSRSTHSFHRDQLFSTRPRLARSGSKTKLDRSQLPPTDPALSSRTHNSHNNNNNHHPESHRSVTHPNSNVEVIGKGYTEEKHSPKSNTTETMDDKASGVSKSRAKIIRGKTLVVVKGDEVFESIDDQQ